MSKLVRHNLLVSPSGRKDHFTSKDQHLETQNFWLKVFYNRSGSGTKVARLEEMFSLNMPLHPGSTRITSSVPDVSDTLIAGVKKLQAEASGSDLSFKRFQSHFFFDAHNEETEEQMDLDSSNQPIGETHENEGSGELDQSNKIEENHDIEDNNKAN
ncbi:hypothetical protein PCASD_00815 [Puccinia coronata f. sp. avenae]|uniref:DUF6589 domain-containing protein n=1 Tax=Puccinia coronata f. sp. avenae TaxID=200324 RepID=A0A2N5VPJ2_9BASI|nr:hypothetical protein PCASD_00815 [Puccinia coronata f. sp. avenae]